ncbi:MULTISPECIES: carotenoid biosynthesis protein [Legionella]|uniref:Carotenoid biosynthesis protein n=1 Tax=Legionella resiliens TaxID=2905958 RepID=A0ABS8WWK4_9GAMM|nr:MULTISPECIES: carotenoid biosynthesis protein [unclassified Legionella]MCE0721697.1 carotenoid biosynthesis protein [Legionella sp. 9fVS26]MCE3530851.1 carotenoid biosynthesis protein [Legionella sp. 8cVS16]QLZ70414.1 carotenoid biosynthesis protein [Legionella sp. PC1000]
MTENVATSNRGSIIRWTVITIYFLTTLFSAAWHGPLAVVFLPIILVFTIFISACLHGKERYGLKNLILFFIITWLVSHFFEALSIQTGFPFGHYYYDKLAGPRFFQVPLIIMLAYFGTGYASWILAHILLGQYAEPLAGKQIFLVPLIAAFIMVMWDVCMDPLSSTVYSLWVWRDGGPYFGVPLQNYFGWFFVVYIIYQIFAVYIAKHDVMARSKHPVFSSKNFWREAVAIYAIQALSQLVDPLGASTHFDISASMALITVFTMMFVVLLASLKINATHLGVPFLKS